MKNIVGLVFLIPISFVAFAAENPEKSPFVTRGVDLGHTGTPRPQRANSLQRAQTIRVNLPRRTSNDERKKIVDTSPRSDHEFRATRKTPVVLPQEPFDFSKPATPKTIPSYAVQK